MAIAATTTAITTTTMAMMTTATMMSTMSAVTTGGHPPGPTPALHHQEKAVGQSTPERVVNLLLGGATGPFSRAGRRRRHRHVGEQGPLWRETAVGMTTTITLASDIGGRSEAVLFPPPAAEAESAELEQRGEITYHSGQLVIRDRRQRCPFKVSTELY